MRKQRSKRRVKARLLAHRWVAEYEAFKVGIDVAAFADRHGMVRVYSPAMHYVRLARELIY